MPYLLDTTVVSDLVRNPNGRIAAKIAAIGEDQVFTSLTVTGELHFGASRRGSRRLTEQLQRVLATLEVLPLDPPVDILYGELRAGLEGSGRPIGPNDLWIAAHALALGHTLVTDDEQEFARVPGLRMENWLR